MVPTSIPGYPKAGVGFCILCLYWITGLDARAVSLLLVGAHFRDPLRCLEVEQRQLVTVAVLPVMICCLWYGKNQVIFGSFSSSSLMGLSLSNVTTLTLPKEVLAHHIARSELSPWATVSRYRDLPGILDGEEFVRPTGIPVLDETRKSTGHLNFNSLEVKLASESYLDDSLFVLRHYPEHYRVAVSLAHDVFFSPGSMSVYFSKENRDATHYMRMLYNYTIYGAGAEGRVQQPHFGYSDQWHMPVNRGYLIIALSVLILGWASWRSIATIVRADWTTYNIVVGYMFGNLLIIYAAGTLLEVSENNRYRFVGEPLFWVLVATALINLWTGIRDRISATRHSECPQSEQV